MTLFTFQTQEFQHYNCGPIGVNFISLTLSRWNTENREIRWKQIFSRQWKRFLSPSLKVNTRPRENKKKLSDTTLNRTTLALHKVHKCLIATESIFDGKSLEEREQKCRWIAITTRTLTVINHFNSTMMSRTIGCKEWQTHYLIRFFFSRLIWYLNFFTKTQWHERISGSLTEDKRSEKHSFCRIDDAVQRHIQ